MTQIILYVLLNYCSGDCFPAALSEPDGGLLFTSLEDCRITAKELDDFGNKATVYKDGKPIGKMRGWHYTCSRSFFADYAQTERLEHGKVTCSYVTTMPESVMARRLDPYDAQHHCSMTARHSTAEILVNSMRRIQPPDPR